MLTEERIETIFKEMNSYVLELAHEPSMLGPQYFQDIIATCRGYLNKVSLVISELNHEKLSNSSELRSLEAIYELEYDNRLANDEHVKRLAHIDDRKSTVGHLLRDQRIAINRIKDNLHALDSVYRVVVHRSRELHATMNAIKDQRRLMQTELSTGAFYGDERVSKGRRAPAEPTGLMAVEDELTAAELEDLMTDSKEGAAPDPVETPAAAPDPKPPVEVAPEPVLVAEKDEKRLAVEPNVPKTEVSEDDVLRFLEGGRAAPPQAVVPAAKTEEEELLNILDGL